MKNNHEQLRSDFDYLYELRELDDMVPIEDNMMEFMENPTKKYASGLYLSAILLWFSEQRRQPIHQNTSRLMEIAEMYSEELGGEELTH